MSSTAALTPGVSARLPERRLKRSGASGDGRPFANASYSSGDWYDVWLGAILTAALFELGKFGIAYYIGKQGLESTYGAAASIIVVLVWVYYSSQIILIGAEITHAFAKTQGSKKASSLAESGPSLSVK